MPSRSRRKSAPSMRSRQQLHVHVVAIELREMAGCAIEQRVPHERRAADTTVRVAGDRVRQPRVDRPRGEGARQRHGRDDLGRTAEEREQFAFFAVHDRHLVHGAARRAGEDLLGALREQRELARLARRTEAGRDRTEDRDLDRRRRAEPLRLRDRGGDEHAQAGERQALLADEERNGAEHVRAPRIPAGEGRRELVERGMRERVRVGCDAPSAADRDHAPVLGRLRGGERCDAQRQLEHEPAGVVGDPAEDVEPARGARDRDRCAGGEERARADVEAERLGVARIEARGTSDARRGRRHGRSLPYRPLHGEGDVHR